jgi:phage gpG-like protein
MAVNNNHQAIARFRAQLLNSQNNILVTLGGMAQSAFADNFTKQGLDGKHWQEVQRRTPGTKAYRWPSGARKSSSRTSPILVRTGTLRRAVAQSFDRAIERNQIVFKVDLPYAAAQQYGTKSIPARPFMGWDKQLKERMQKYIDRGVKQAFKNSGN